MWIKFMFFIVIEDLNKTIKRLQKINSLVAYSDSWYRNYRGCELWGKIVNFKLKKNYKKFIVCLHHTSIDALFYRRKKISTEPSRLKIIFK